jgi:hypothetical protein
MSEVALGIACFALGFSVRGILEYYAKRRR